MLPGAAGPATRVAGAGKNPPAQAPRSSRSNSQDQTATQKQSAAAATAKKAAASPPRPAAIPNPKPRSSGRFLWPVKGRLISSFGTKSGGLHNDGINIAAPRGAPIVAAENGVVAYVGNELRGFGNLVLIKHADNYITAYAHADEILVSRGQQVTRGQTVARVGSSGSVSDPQLHFEVRRGTKAIDPASVLGTATAAIVDHSQGLGGA
jgi:murein DD-endopeptidase MepM/ murein hydrolase activator NlpD